MKPSVSYYFPCSIECVTGWMSEDICSKITIYFTFQVFSIFFWKTQCIIMNLKVLMYFNTFNKVLKPVREWFITKYHWKYVLENIGTWDKHIQQLLGQLQHRLFSPSSSQKLSDTGIILTTHTQKYIYSKIPELMELDPGLDRS